MPDTLVMGGTTYSGVTGFIATDNSDNTVTYIKPAGTKSISANGTGIDVAEYAAVDVAVSGGGGLTHESGDITPASNTQYLSVTGLNGTPKFIKYVIDNMDSTESGGGKDGTLKMLRGIYVLGASTAQASNSGGAGYGSTYTSPVATWESITPTVSADGTQPDAAGQIIATTTGFCARSYNSNYCFRAGYKYNYDVWY